MRVLIALAICIVFALVLRKPIKRFPAAFYAFAIIVDVVFLSQILLDSAPVFARALFPYLQRSLFGFGFLVIVMFLGVLPESSKARKTLAPIRGELSIIGAILVVGHAAYYFNSYLNSLLAGFMGMSASMVVSFIVSAVLIALLALLTTTSFVVVKKRMKPIHWKRLQKLAYPFILLVYVHLMLLLLPSASIEGNVALVSILIYTVLMISYVVLRIRRVKVDSELRVRESTYADADKEQKRHRNRSL